MALQKEYLSKYRSKGNYWFITKVEFSFSKGTPYSAVITISLFTSKDDMLQGADSLEDFVFSINQEEFLQILQTDEGNQLFSGVAGICYNFAVSKVVDGPNHLILNDSIWVE